MVGFGMARALFRAALPTWVRAGMRPAQIVSVARVQGWGFRYTNMLSDIRQYTGWAKHESGVRSALLEKPLSKFNMTSVQMTRPFAYRIKADCTYLDRETGETFTKVVTMYDDSNRGPDGWLARYKETEVWQEYGRDFEVIGMKFFSGDYDPRYI